MEYKLSVPGVGIADGALGEFTPPAAASPIVIIELKDADKDLDRDKSQGRTPVQQCWDYLNALPDCPWGIVSNFVSIRLYHRDRGSQAYQEFRLQELRKPEVFRQFYCLFEYGAFLQSKANQQPRALSLLERTSERQRAVGDDLYKNYNHNRYGLVEFFVRKRGKTLAQAIHIAQKLLDRVIFIAFCEDRGLIPEKRLGHAYEHLPAFSDVTNPRWRNFLLLFKGMDKGNPRDLQLEKGYNGGLFADDPEVDNVELLDDEPWTNFFHTIGTYDFRDEINVDVLGHLFERSVGDLQRLQSSGLSGVARPEQDAKGVAGTTTLGTPFEDSGRATRAPKMAKSPERKRSGIYYTPPEFTRFIVDNTVIRLLDERFAALREKHKLKEDPERADKPSPALRDYWNDCLETLKRFTVCDPACGSGAFLIQAYDALEEQYHRVADNLELHDRVAADRLRDAIPDLILTHNLYGVDLSEQAVEITQLALWIRSARRDKTLADLSKNIVWGNSLVTDPSVHPKALKWEAAFPGVLGVARPEHGSEGRGEPATGAATPFEDSGRATQPPIGFDCVMGNPPWERLKLQEREFFALSAPKIAEAVNAATRRRLIAELEKDDPALFERYTRAKEEADQTLTHVRGSGGFPLTAKGDINTYMLFAELARRLVAPTGRVGLLVPSGIATDNTTREFFNDLMESKALVALYDFENRLRIFPDIDGRMKFCVLLVGGAETRHPQADFVFFAHAIEDLNDKKRHIALSSADMALMNPNTRTCPVFRSRRDAELTKAIYKRVPILIDQNRAEGGNPWGIKFITMFHQTNDAELFEEPEKLEKRGFKRVGNVYRKGKEICLPLYEAKMIQAFDHRAASVVIDPGNWVRQGQTEETSLVSHQNPEFVVQPRWWVDETSVLAVLKGKHERGFIGFKDITSPTNERTMIAAAIPWSAVTNHFPLMVTNVTPRLALCLLANLNALVLDYVARQKIGGVTLNFFIVEQFPMFSPDRYAARCPWAPRQTLEKWISDRVLKLTCTANDMKPLAEAAGFEPAVHKWNEAERAELRAELDAAFFHLYEIERDDVEYILGTFQGLRDDAGGLFESGTSILEAYDRLAEKG